MNAWNLYVIVDAASAGKRNPAELAHAALDGGADVIQFRSKLVSEKEFFQQAEKILQVCRKFDRPFVVNDRIAVALALGAEGIHLGQDDLPLEQARRLIGSKAFIGVSTHSLTQAQKAEEQGADYIGVGPVFSTPTKPSYEPVGLDLVRQVHQSVMIPKVAIGGIDLSNASRVVEEGARCIAVVRAVCAAADPSFAAKELKNLLRIPHSKRV
ncbi:MAG: thiamine phosphate synthase [Candidatus Omnitrophica bacterium]|nr:thiamine phosphate synthase [Candidatus Omnitrophota bacterium]